MMLANPLAPSRLHTGAPPWAYLSVLSSAVLALVTMGLLAVVLLGAGSSAPARPVPTSVATPNVVWPHRAVLARVAVPAAYGDPVGGPGGDPGPSAAPEDDFGNAVAGATERLLPATLVALVTLALAAAVWALMIRARSSAGGSARRGG